MSKINVNARFLSDFDLDKTQKTIKIVLKNLAAQGVEVKEDIVEEYNEEHEIGYVEHVIDCYNANKSWRVVLYYPSASLLSPQLSAGTIFVKNDSYKRAGKYDIESLDRVMFLLTKDFFNDIRVER